MADLRDIQRAFQRYLAKDDDEIIRFVVGSEAAQADHRLATYFNAYRIRLIDSLAINYPALKQLLGEQRFEQLALDYLDSHPSANYSIRWFGDQLADFLVLQKAPEDSALISELARFEWSRSTVFDEKHSHHLVNPEQMAGLPPRQWPQLRFTFKPAIRLLDLHYNVVQIVSALEQKTATPEVIKLEHPVRWLIWRQQLDIHWRSLAVEESWALEMAMQGRDFSFICNGLGEWLEADQIALRAAGLVKQWITDQLITNLQ